MKAPITILLLIMSLLPLYVYAQDSSDDKAYLQKRSEICNSIANLPYCTDKQMPYWQHVNNGNKYGATNKEEFIQKCINSKTLICYDLCNFNSYCNTSQYIKQNIRPEDVYSKQDSCRNECQKTLDEAYHKTSEYKQITDRNKQTAVQLTHAYNDDQISAKMNSMCDTITKLYCYNTQQPYVNLLVSHISTSQYKESCLTNYHKACTDFCSYTYSCIDYKPSASFEENKKYRDINNAKCVEPCEKLMITMIRKFAPDMKTGLKKYDEKITSFDISSFNLEEEIRKRHEISNQLQALANKQQEEERAKQELARKQQEEQRKQQELARIAKQESKQQDSNQYENQHTTQRDNSQCLKMCEIQYGYDKERIECNLSEELCRNKKTAQLDPTCMNNLSRAEHECGRKFFHYRSDCEYKCNH